MEEKIYSIEKSFVEIIVNEKRTASTVARILGTFVHVCSNYCTRVVCKCVIQGVAVEGGTLGLICHQLLTFNGTRTAIILR